MMRFPSVLLLVLAAAGVGAQTLEDPILAILPGEVVGNVSSSCFGGIQGTPYDCRVAFQNDFGGTGGGERAFFASIICPATIDPDTADPSACTSCRVAVDQMDCTSCTICAETDVVDYAIDCSNQFTKEFAESGVTCSGELIAGKKEQDNEEKPDSSDAGQKEQDNEEKPESSAAGRSFVPILSLVVAALL